MTAVILLCWFGIRKRIWQ